MSNSLLKIQVQTLPTLPGVYQYFDVNETIIYIGKAKNLKKRVSSYFTKTHDSGKTKVLVKKIAQIKHIVVETETDALLLENNLIKKYRPRYNVLLKDDKSYPWICIKNERFPRVFQTRRLLKDGSEYFGPYTSVKTVYTLLDLVRGLYQLRTCKFDLSQEKIESGKYIFDVQTPSETIKNIEFHLPGNHNVMNALAALAMADVYGVSLETIKERLSTFKGVKRRFSYKIKTDNLVLIDDYAHHPTEINAVENSIREMYPDEKVLVVFQPHLFSRTRDFIDDFANAISKFDEVLLLDIYPAREEPIPNVNSEWLLSKIKTKKKKLVQKNNVLKDIKNSSAKVVAMLGAGDIGVLINEVTNQLLKNQENED